MASGMFVSPPFAVLQSVHILSRPNYFRRTVSTATRKTMAPYGSRGARGGGGGGRGRGRGAYYANKYGGRRNQNIGGEESGGDPETMRKMGGLDDLANFLKQCNHAPYPRYKEMVGEWQLLNNVSFFVDRVQSDPYAPPSRARVRVGLEASGFPSELYSTRIRTTAFCDFLTRKFYRLARDEKMDQGRGGQGWSGPKGGNLNIDCPGQHVLERTSCLLVNKRFIEIRFTVNLPARGRSIEGFEAAKLLTEQLPTVLKQVVFATRNDAQQLHDHVISVEDQEYLRDVILEEKGLIAFVRNGAVLPRDSGASDSPMRDSSVVKFQTPDSLAVEVTLPSGRTLTGMGIKKGISLIVGGGFHGKSTLLAALEVGIYNHIPGDGREFVCVEKSTVSIRAEDGRSVTGVDITPFINNLPFEKATDCFSTPDASGSTSQAANIIEALEAGAKVLLTDEDLAATNFMMRDQRMQQLVPSGKEPITPMIQRIRALYDQEDVSSILVIGGAGDYFEVSDLVVMMDCYKPIDVTEKAKKIAKRVPSGLDLDTSPKGIFKSKRKRRLSSNSLRRVTLGSKGQPFTRAKLKGSVEIGRGQLDLSGVSQLVEISQTRAIGSALETIGGMSALEREGVAACVNQIMKMVREKGLDALNNRGERVGNYACPRAIEVLAALNRVRGMDVAQ